MIGVWLLFVSFLYISKQKTTMLSQKRSWVIVSTFSMDKQIGNKNRCPRTEVRLSFLCFYGCANRKQQLLPKDKTFVIVCKFSMDKQVGNISCYPRTEHCLFFLCFLWINKQERRTTAPTAAQEQKFGHCFYFFKDKQRANYNCCPGTQVWSLFLSFLLINKQETTTAAQEQNFGYCLYVFYGEANRNNNCCPRTVVWLLFLSFP